ncbi:restriction endonuclease subunit S [Vibrio splendidus]|uniref:restriction endonuclease subunit S n=1 Tax=Vibrio splendidus TaxID=29497 RepID=UPI000C81EDB4|nr:restriction endonuclease subunit S [Vibrio splendidus]PMP02554.1 hypothetical protein BCS97_23435 [Vibrio splendidus]PMP23606.1 hypothetical protein BCS89_02720 [Vibrio splendidus]PMP30995.1 hypothetical protein BCS88_17755 [Vibrio splendidus]PMP37163.1 hypothetical protein BCS87_15700 [Vibrio splendidus]PMP42530.1 hypothetical protein BCS85_21205 [Vibrio splendidus]
MSNLAPAGWTSSKFGSLTKSIKSGLSRRIVSQDIGLPVLISGNIQNNNLDTSELKYWYVDDPQGADTSRYLLNDGDILLCFINSLAQIGKVCIYSDIGRATIYTTNLFRVVAHEDFSSSYVYQLMTNQPFQEEIQLITKPAVNQASFTKADLEEIPVIFPPLPEQKKIAAILTSVDDVIEKTQAQIDKLKDLKTGMMQELLTRGVGVDGKPHTEFKDSPVGRIPKGWVIEIFGDVFDLKNGVNKGKEFFGNGVPIISYRNVYDGNGIYDYMLSNKVEMTEGELERFKVRKGDVFITRTSETPDEIGFTNVYLGDLDNVVFNGFVIRARQKTDIFDCDYSKYAFQADYMRQQMIHSSKFTTRAGISGESLSLLKVIVPPLIEQQKIGKAISSVDARINSLIKLRDSKSSLKKALMQDLLTGKVRVKVEG